MAEPVESEILELNEVLPALAVEYGTPTAFANGHPLKFPDFELMCRGRSTVPSNSSFGSWVFRLRDAHGDREIAIASGGALSEPGAEWLVGDQQFTMDWVPAGKHEPRQVVVRRFAVADR